MAYGTGFKRANSMKICAIGVLLAASISLVFIFLTFLDAGGSVCNEGWQQGYIIPMSRFIDIGGVVDRLAPAPKVRGWEYDLGYGLSGIRVINKAQCFGEMLEGLIDKRGGYLSRRVPDAV